MREVIEGDGPDAAERRDRAEEEMGDLFFAMANLSRKLGVEPETALRKANEKFTARFEAMERAIAAKGRTMREMTIEELEAEWQRDQEPDNRHEGHKDVNHEDTKNEEARRPYSQDESLRVHRCSIWHVEIHQQSHAIAATLQITIRTCASMHGTELLDGLDFDDDRPLDDTGRDADDRGRWPRYRHRNELLGLERNAAPLRARAASRVRRRAR